VWYIGKVQLQNRIGCIKRANDPGEVLKGMKSRRYQQNARRWLYSFLAACTVVCICFLRNNLILAEPPSVTIAQAARTADPAAEDGKTLPAGNAPLKVSIGLHVSNLAGIDQSSESFEVAGYLLYTWKDSRLAFTPRSANEESRSTSLDSIWYPAIEMVNFKSSSAADTIVDILPDGTVQVQERFSKTLSSGLSLQKFPFDKQSLQVVLESLKYGEKQVTLIADSEKISIGKDSFVTLSEWNIKKIFGRQSKSFFPPEKQHYSRVIIEVFIQRNPGFYVLKVMVPLLLITIASWAVFWIDPREFSTQITIAFTNLLTIVALLLVINDSLPRVGYLTFMDGFTMLCFITILLVILELLFAHYLETQDRANGARKVHRLARWIVPITFTALNIALLVLVY
jgi:hypothetical protein